MGLHQDSSRGSHGRDPRPRGRSRSSASWCGHTALMNASFRRARDAGMNMVVVETGGDPGHALARATYEKAGFERWPVARYVKRASLSPWASWYPAAERLPNGERVSSWRVVSVSSCSVAPTPRCSHGSGARCWTSSCSIARTRFAGDRAVQGVRRAEEPVLRGAPGRDVLVHDTSISSRTDTSRRYGSPVRDKMRRRADRPGSSASERAVQPAHRAIASRVVSAQVPPRTHAPSTRGLAVTYAARFSGS